MKALVFIFLFWWIPVLIGMIIYWYAYIKKLSKNKPVYVQSESKVQNRQDSEIAWKCVSSTTRSNSYSKHSYKNEKKNEMGTKPKAAATQKSEKPAATNVVLPPDYDGSTIVSLENQLTDDEADVVDSAEYKEAIDMTEKESVDIANIPDDLGEMIN